MKQTYLIWGNTLLTENEAVKTVGVNQANGDTIELDEEKAVKANAWWHTDECNDLYGIALVYAIQSADGRYLLILSHDNGNKSIEFITEEEYKEITVGD